MRVLLQVTFHNLGRTIGVGVGAGQESLQEKYASLCSLSLP
jgi:hypothetical protein